MAKTIGQSSSANVHIGPLLNISASVMSGLAIDNDAIILIKEGGASAARSQTTSAASIGPGIYRIVLNTTDTDTLGALEVIVSGSGAILHRETVEIWQNPTYQLFFGSADEIATSADFATLSATVAGVSAAVAGVSVAVANVSAAIPTSAEISGIVLQALQDQLLHTLIAASASTTAVNANSLIGLIMTSADPTAFDRNSDSLAAIADGAGATPLTSAQVSSIVLQGLQDQLLHTLVAASASVTAVQANSLFGLIMTSSDPTTYDRTSDSLAAIADGAGATPLTSAQVSGIVLQGLQDQLLHTLIAASASVTAVNANSLVGRIMASADPVAFDRTTDSLEAISNAQLTSAGVSNQVDTVLTNYGVPTSANMSAMVTVVVAQALSDYGVPTSANMSAMVSVVASNVVDLALTNFGVPTSAAMSAMVSVVVSNVVENAVFQRTLDQPTSAPGWADMPFDNAMEWMVARSLNRHAQTGTEIEIFTSGGTAFASASVDNNSVSAIRDQWI